MFRCLLLATVCLVATWAILPAPLDAGDVRDLKPGAKIVMDHGPLAYKPQLNFVIRSAEELVANSSKPLESKDPRCRRRCPRP